jgi:hypothetical protein
MSVPRGDGGRGAARALVVSWVSVLAAAMAHTLAGGHTPRLGLLAVLVGVIGLGCAPLLAAARLGWWRGLFASLVAQAASHLVLGAAATSTMAPMSSGGAHRHSSLGVPAAVAPDATHQMAGLSPRMTAAHLGAAVLLVGVIRYVERAHARLSRMVAAVRRVGEVFARLLPTTPVGVPVSLRRYARDAVRVAIRGPLRVAPDVWSSPVAARRGPPRRPLV